jgi:Protein of unknown function VcgC/VcgE (DUF2780)
MTRVNVLGIVCLTLLVTSPNAWAQEPQAAPDAAKKAPAATDAAAAAVKASPELVEALSKELASTPEQAAGAAGALLGVAKSRLKPEEFSQVSAAVPGTDALLKAAPALGAVGTSGALSQLAGSASGLATAASAFSKLGLKPDMVAKAVPVLTSFVTKSGGSAVGSLLAGALK